MSIVSVKLKPRKFPDREHIPIYTAHIALNNYSPSVWAFVLDDQTLKRLVTDDPISEYINKDEELFTRLLEPHLTGYLAGVEAGIVFDETDGIVILKDFNQVVWFRSFRDYVCENHDLIHSYGYATKLCQHPLFVNLSMTCQSCVIKKYDQDNRTWKDIHYRLHYFVHNYELCTRYQRETIYDMILADFPIVADYYDDVANETISFRGRSNHRDMIRDHNHHIHRKCPECVICHMIDAHVGHQFHYDFVKDECLHCDD